MKARRVRHVSQNEGFKTVAYTTLAAAFPGIVLFAIPPVLVALTGLMFIPLAFNLARRAHKRERAALEAWETTLMNRYSERARCSAQAVMLDSREPLRSRISSLRFLGNNYRRELTRTRLGNLAHSAG